MKTKTINLYKFEELTAEQQEKVLDKYRDWNDDLTCDLINHDEIHLIKLKEKVELCKQFAQEHPDILLCSSNYFHNHFEREPREAGKLVFVVDDDLVQYLNGLIYD